ncbi:MAG: DUF429 domain-containing protein [Humibacillus sp.]|nr:DUF429 domain-containing protein [Humibacillus sp.]MDN5776311.1 DUF429 domain-containing protein [Humibacillus sp.]
MSPGDATTAHRLALALEAEVGALVRATAHEPAARPSDVSDALAAATRTLARLTDVMGAGQARSGDDRSVEPVEVTVPVLGVDGCRGGWVGAVLEPGAPRPRIAVAKGIGELVETVRSSLGVVVVGIDIPIGLPDTTTRQADALARQALRGKASSVFTTLTRAAYAAPDRAAADAVNRARCGQGVGAQAFALRDKIVEVDAWVRSRPTLTVIEVHPELSFAAMSGSPIRPNKKTDAGRTARLQALRSVGIASPSILTGSGYGADDVLDACAVAWTAARYANGAARSRPPAPEHFSDGIPAAIWA